MILISIYRNTLFIYKLVSKIDLDFLLSFTRRREWISYLGVRVITCTPFTYKKERKKKKKRSFIPHEGYSLWKVHLSVTSEWSRKCHRCVTGVLWLWAHELEAVKWRLLVTGASESTHMTTHWAVEYGQAPSYLNTSSSEHSEGLGIGALVMFSVLPGVFVTWNASTIHRNTSNITFRYVESGILWMILLLFNSRITLALIKLKIFI